MQNAPTTQTPSIYRKAVGDMVLTAILDGVLFGDYSLVNGIDPTEAARVQTAQFRPGKPIIAINCFVVHHQDRVILIDTGAGPNFDGGQLPSALNAAGVQPDSVDTVLLTHLHPDHAGGLATKDGRAFFPNAELVLHADEAAFWLETANPPAEMAPFFEGTKASVAPYRDRMRTFTRGEVAPGIEAMPLQGHTPGHTGYHLASGSDQLVIWGDIVHLPVLQSRHPEVTMVFDIDPDQARAQRRRMFDKVASEGALVAGAHLDFPALAHIERGTEGSYRVVPDVWRPMIGASTPSA